MTTNTLKIGTKAKAFCLPNSQDQKRCLKDFLGQWVVVYFYPKDNTPGCTKEACDFNQQLPLFHQFNAIVLGISPDSVASHYKFSQKQNLEIELLSDEEHKICEIYNAWQLKKNYGREYMGVVRSTILIDPFGRIAHHWPKVKVAGHADQVREKLSELISRSN